MTRSSWTSGWRLRAAIVIAAVAAAILPAPARLVERVYSAGAYLVVQPYVTAASNRVPFALLDALLLFAAGLWIGLLAIDLLLLRAARVGWLRAVLRVAVRTLVWTAALYLAFLLMWGLNYRRVPLADRVQFDAAAVSREAARELALKSVAQVNALYAPAYARGFPDAGVLDAPLAAAFARAQQALGVRPAAVPARPKSTFLNPYFRAAGVQGMTDPYFLETLVASDLLPFERPFTVAHEWSHLAGFADEGEANFVGWLTSAWGLEPAQYSGWLFLYGEAVGTLPAHERAEVASRLASGPREDLAAVAERMARHVSPRLSAAGWRMYDRYLKANRVEAGAASYAEVVRLVLGVKFSVDGRSLAP